MNVVELIRRYAEVPSFSSYEERLPPVMLTAHLDKIKHLGHDSTEKLPFQQTDPELIGQLDVTVGVGLCLRLLDRLHQKLGLSVLLSELEISPAPLPQRWRGTRVHARRRSRRGTCLSFF